METPRETRAQRRAAPRAEREALAQDARRQQRRQRRLWWGATGVGVVAVLGGGAFAVQSGQAGAAPTIAGIACVTTEGNVTHTHQHLAIYNRGVPVPVPQGIGVNESKGCLFALHTHSADGVLHVESPSQDQNTLGQFFAIWGQPLSQTQVGSATDARGIRAYVDGQRVSGDPRAIALTPHALITLETGPPWVPPTTRYSWPGGT